MNKKLSIRGKLLLLVLPLGILAAVVLAVYSRLVVSVSNQSKEVYHDQLYHGNSALIRADRDLNQAYGAILEFIVSNMHGAGDVTLLTEFNEKMQQTQDNVLTVKEIMEQYPDMKEYSYNGLTLTGEYEKFVENMAIVSEIAKGDKNTLLVKKIAEPLKVTRDNLANMETIIEAYSDESEEALAIHFRTISISIFAGTLIFLVLIALMSGMVIHYVRFNVKKVTDSIDTIANKDLSKEVCVVEGRDEIAQLSVAAASLREQFRTMLETLQSSSDSLADSSKLMAENTDASVQSMQSIDQAAGELAHTASQQADDISKMASDMVNIDEMTRESVSETESLAAACGDIEKITQNGMETVNHLTAVTEKSMQAFDNIFRVIEGIDEKTKTIGKASDMITDIASQTNLLSLNASIEAARAGDAGRGFAVVADEIRQLAEQSAGSANTINAMLSALMQSAAEATKTSQAVKELVEQQRKSVMDTKDGFVDIVNNITIVNTGVDNLRSVNQGLGRKVDAITELIDSLSAASQENAATAEELSATTTSVTGSINDLESAGLAVSDSSKELASIIRDYKLTDEAVDLTGPVEL